MNFEEILAVFLRSIQWICKWRDALHKVKCNIGFSSLISNKDQEIKTGDIVLCKNLHRSNKLEPIFEMQLHKVMKTCNNAVITTTSRSTQDEKCSLFKKSFMVICLILLTTTEHQILNILLLVRSFMAILHNTHSCQHTYTDSRQGHFSQNI